MPEDKALFAFTNSCDRAQKALTVALSFCRLLGLGCPKQAFAKIATPRVLSLIITTEPLMFPSDVAN